MTRPGHPLRLHRDAAGRLVLTDDAGVEHVGVVPVRAFPLAAPDEGLAIVGPTGRELAWVERLDALDAATRRLVDEELAPRELVPEIRRLVRVSSVVTPSTWHVETDRGDTEFVLKAEEDIRRLPGGALLIASAHGMHYRIADRAALDRGSRKLLDRFL
jgi:hypothetical protein